MHHSPQGTNLTLESPNQIGRFPSRITAMNDHGQIEIMGDGQLGPEGLSL